jgi:hypothetical protein
MHVEPKRFPKIWEEKQKIPVAFWKQDSCAFTMITWVSYLKRLEFGKRTLMGECLSFVHCTASLQVVKRVLGRSQGNWLHLASEYLKSSRAQMPI